MRFVASITRRGSLVARNSIDDIPGETPERTATRAEAALLRDADRPSPLAGQELADARAIAKAFRDLVLDALADRTHSIRTIGIRDGVATTHDMVRIGRDDDRATIGHLEAFDDAWIAERERFTSAMLGETAAA